MFEGVSVAVVTPFSRGDLDEPALRRVVRHVLDQGVDGIVATGSTGEGGTLSDEERVRVWRACAEEATGRAFVLAGTGTPSTETTIRLSRRAKETGVDGCLVVAPAYAKPTPKGLLAHFLAVADAVDLPIVLYNIPGRTAVNVLPETIAILARHPRIVAVKESSGSLDQATEILTRCDITVLSGDDSLAIGHYAAGGKGLVSVAAHVAGRDLVRLDRAMREGRLEEARAIHLRLYPLVRALFLESNPAPVKAALSFLGLIENELRLPLVPVSEGAAVRLREEMTALGFLTGS